MITILDIFRLASFIFLQLILLFLFSNKLWQATSYVYCSKTTKIKHPAKVASDLQTKFYFAVEQ